MMVLSPFTSRYLDEHVTPIMDSVYYILQKRGLLPDVPQALLDNPFYEIDFVGKDDEYSQLLTLKTGDKDVLPDGVTSDYDAYIYVYKSKPHPLNLIAIAMDVEISN